MSKKLLDWADFNRTHHGEFYGCVDKEGHWFDSGTAFSTAVHWLCCHCGAHGLTQEQELEYLNTTAAPKGYSIVHSSMLQKMYMQGLMT